MSKSKHGKAPVPPTTWSGNLNNLDPGELINRIDARSRFTHPTSLQVFRWKLLLTF